MRPRLYTGLKAKIALEVLRNVVKLPNWRQMGAAREPASLEESSCWTASRAFAGGTSKEPSREAEGAEFYAKIVG
jgi:hypothetical protein